MKSNFDKSKELAFLNLYLGYLKDSGIESTLVPSQTPESLDLLQLSLFQGQNLNMLFVPLGEANFQTLSLIQFYVLWPRVNRDHKDSLLLVNAMNQKIPLAKLSLNSDNLLEYHYYLPISSQTPLSKQEFMERISLILSHLEVVYSIWLQDEPVEKLLKKVAEF